MKRRKLDKVKCKLRITEHLIIVLTAIITPRAIKYANSVRDVKGYGGEYLIPLLAVLAIMIIETFLEERKERKHAKNI